MGRPAITRSLGARLTPCLVLVLLFLLSTVDLASAYVEIDDGTWIRQVTAQDQPLTLNCSEFPINPTNESGPILADASITGWLLPDFTIVSTDWSGTNRAIRDEGWEFHFYNVSAADVGVYHCVWLLASGEQYLVKWGVNIRGPFFVDLWDKYQQNTIIACIASGSFLAVAIIVMATFYFRYKPKHTPDYDVTHAYSNGGCVDAVYDVVGTFPPPPPLPRSDMELKDMPSWGSDTTPAKKTEPAPDYSPGPDKREFWKEEQIGDMALRARNPSKTKYDEDVSHM